MKHILYSILILALFICLAPVSDAQMESANYSIPTSVLSGGGAPMSATSYQTNSTLGQPSPLPDSADPPFSDSFDLYPGFWYALMGPKCEGDHDSDGDVDGSDLAAYVAGDLSVSLEEFAQDFGRVNCP